MVFRHQLRWEKQISKDPGAWGGEHREGEEVELGDIAKRMSWN